MSIAVGQTLPDATFNVLTDQGPSQQTTADVFAGRKVILFAVPGAFTPTCHNQHLPSYLRQHDALKAKGVDTIACVAVNDMFVMDAWAKSAGAGDRILFLSDGNGAFTRALGLEMDGSKYGMGMRSQRYSMIVEDGVVRELNVEQPGKFEVSSADFTVCQL